MLTITEILIYECGLSREEAEAINKELMEED